MTRPEKLIFLVQRYYEEVAGGSERLAGAWAELARDEYDVEIWTTCAKSSETWANEFKPGKTQIKGIPVRRFPVVQERDAAWRALHKSLCQDFLEWKKEPQEIDHQTLELTFPGRLERWPLALQLEWLRRQGPHAPEMLAALLQENSAAFLATPYLYATTALPAFLLPAERFLLAPALHDEPPAYLPLLRHAAKRAARLLFLTGAERSLAQDLWPELLIPDDAFPIGLPVPEADSPGKLPENYALYLGRMDASKGAPDMVRLFAHNMEKLGSLELYIAGENPDPALLKKARKCSRIKFLGHVKENEKNRLIAGARAMLVPSAMESFSISAIEAMALGVPVLVNGLNPVLLEHARAGGAIACVSDEEYINALLLLSDNNLRLKISENARQASKKYHPRAVQWRLLEQLKLAWPAA